MQRLRGVWLVMVALGLALANEAGAQLRPLNSGNGSGSSSVTTGSVTVLTPLVLSGTEVQLPQSISQLNTNRALTNVSANTLRMESGTAYSLAAHPSMNGLEFWDDFDRTVTNSPGTAPSGHPWKFDSTIGRNSNNVFTADGYFKIATNATYGAAYWYVENTNGNSKWNRFGGSFRYLQHSHANGYQDLLGFLVATNSSLAGNWLHVGVNLQGIYIQKQITTYLLNETYPTILQNDTEHNFEIIIENDTIFARVGQYQYVIRDDTITNYNAGTMVFYEHNRNLTNLVAQYRGEWGSAYAGQASPMYQMFNSLKLNTNGTIGKIQSSVVETTGRFTNSSSSGGGFWSTDSAGFVSLTDANNYLLMSQPQGGIFGTLDGWVLGDANSSRTIFEISTNTSTVTSNLWVKGTNFARQIKLVGGQTAARPAFIDANTNIVAATGTPDGTKFLRDDGVLAVPSGSGGGGGTNFPNVNILAGNTNLVLSAGVRKAFHNQTNGSHGINLNLAVPESGYVVTYSVSNSSASDITVTFYTNSVAANPYDIATKTNVNTFTASASGITKVRLTYTANGLWLLDQVAGPAAVLKFSDGIIRDTNGANGLDITVSTKRLTNYAHATTITINGATDVDMTVTNDLAAGVTYTIATPTIGSSGVVRFRPDGSARTVAFQTWPAAIVPLSTNRFSNVTNIDLAASKWAYWNYDIARGTNGTTNCFVWVIQAP